MVMHDGGSTLASHSSNRSTSRCWLAALVFSAFGCESSDARSDDDGVEQIIPGDDSTAGDQDSAGTADDDESSEASDDVDPGSDDSDFPLDKFDLADPHWPDDDVGECPCESGTDLIYVLGDNQSLWVYDPVANTFAERGTMACESGGDGQTFSMGIARSGQAWVQMRSSRKIYEVELSNNNACSESKFIPNDATFGLSGMAFASRGNDNPCDDLHLLAFTDGNADEMAGAGRLGRFDPATGDVALVGPTNYTGGELTGTSDGRIYGFAGVNPAKLIQFDRETGEENESIALDGLELSNAFAFAFWGGDFYFFTQSPTNIPFASQVTRLDYDGTKTLEVVNPKAPALIVGAGVSTCVPLFPPK
jgi:hypothetical protein